MLNLSGVALRRGRRLLFENVSLQVQAGHRVGLVGANGSGKTSLFAAVLGELEVDQGEIALAAGTRIAHVAQASPSGNQPALEFVMDGDQELRDTQRAIAAAENRESGRGLHQLYERMERIDGFSAEARAARLLNGLGFAGTDNQRPVEEFSGGWRMRLNLAQALMCRSDLLLLDEPTNHLDLPAILWLESWLKRYTGALLLVSHDRDFLDALCTRIAHIDHQQIRLYTGNYSGFERVRSEQLSLQQNLFKRQQKEIRHLQSYVDRFRYKASKARQAQSRLKMLERMTVISPAHVDSPFDFRFMEPPRQPRQLTRLESVAAGYDKPVLTNVELMVTAGDLLTLLVAWHLVFRDEVLRYLLAHLEQMNSRRALASKIGRFSKQLLAELEATGAGRVGPAPMAARLLSISTRRCRNRASTRCLPSSTWRWASKSISRRVRASRPSTLIVRKHWHGSGGTYTIPLQGMIPYWQVPRTQLLFPSKPSSRL